MENIQSGIVDEDIDWAERIGDSMPKQTRLFGIGQIRIKARVSGARKAGETGRGGLAVIAIVNRYVHAPLRELQSDDAPDSTRCAGHQRDLFSVRVRRFAPSRS